MAEVSVGEIDKVEKIDDRPEARAEDIKKFWEGFKEFRGENKDLESKLRNEVVGELKRRGNSYWNRFKDKNKIVEGMMIFFYGAKLAEDLQPAYTSKLRPPIRKYNSNSGTVAVTREWYEDTGLVVDAFFNLDTEYFKQANKFTTSHTIKWVEEEKFTVSRNFTDISLVNLLLSGAEELAHYLFVLEKSGEKLRVASIGENQAVQEYESQKKLLGGTKADKWYHMSDIERRALTWQQQILNKYFPHWAQPTRDFVRGVKELRMKNKRDSVLTDIYKF